MNQENRIIAIRKRDFHEAHKAFVELMGRTEEILNDEAKKSPNDYKKLSTTSLEPRAVEKIQQACANSPFDPNEIKLISGQKFPDIIAETYYGVEVKTTKEDHWTSTGSSIVESTRDVNVDDIYMLFGKLGGDVPQFKCRPYEEVLYDIAVTHSPRYLIDMNIKKGETIFEKMHTTYNEFRQSEDAISKVRKYYREKAHEAGKAEMPWWITKENVEESQSFNVSLWNTLSIKDKRRLKCMCMILFPEALTPKQFKAKYDQTSLWLCSYNQVIMPNIRDLYSAGGSITHIDDHRLVKPAAQVFYQIVEHAPDIKKMLTCPTKDLLTLIADYNPTLLKTPKLYENWVKQCERNADEYDVPLRKWLEGSHVFTFG